MLIADTPYQQVLVRNEFFYDEKSGHGEYTKAVVFGFRAEPARVPMFQIMTEHGAQWARCPIHMIVTKPCEPLPVEVVTWWDNYGYSFAVLEYKFLRGFSCTALGRDKVIRKGNYLFTIDWMVDGYSEIPDQHKCHHVIALETGQWIAYPNNRLVWADESWIKPNPQKEWRCPTRIYSAES